jgi:hypothetical protein
VPPPTPDEEADMTSRSIVVLAVVAVAALAAGLWLAGRQGSSVSGEARAALYPGLESALDSIDAVRVFKAGDQRAVELKRGEAGWTVTERAGYRADEAKLRDLASALADAELLEEKTSIPEKYAALGVEDVSGKDAKGIRVELAGPSSPVNLIVGNPGAGGSSRYVRRAGEAKSWLIDQGLDAPAEPDAWLDKSIADIAADRVQSATVTVKGAKPYTAAKASKEQANFSVEKLPKGKSLRSPSVADAFATALTGLVLTDAQPESAFGTEPAADHASFRTFDGLVVELDGWKRDDKRFVALKASSVQPDAAEEARTLAAKTSGWIYEIPEYRYQSLFKPLEDLLQQ